MKKRSTNLLALVLVLVLLLLSSAALAADLVGFLAAGMSVRLLFR